MGIDWLLKGKENSAAVVTSRATWRILELSYNDLSHSWAQSPPHGILCLSERTLRTIQPFDISLMKSKDQMSSEVICAYLCVYVLEYRTRTIDFQPAVTQQLLRPDLGLSGLSRKNFLGLLIRT